MAHSHYSMIRNGQGPHQKRAAGRQPDAMLGTVSAGCRECHTNLAEAQ